MEEKSKENYSFIREEIKEKPISKKKILKLIFLVMVLGVLFGAMACISFYFIMPYLREGAETEEKGDTVTFTIPIDELPVGEVVYVPIEKPDASAEEEELDLVTSDEVQTMLDEKETTAEDYQKVISEIYGIGKEANRSIVQVSGIVSDTDFLDLPYESEGITSGMILGDNGSSKLILTQYHVVAEAQNIRVCFCNQKEYEAEIVGYDDATNLAVIGVSLADLDEDTINAVANAKLGNSYQVEAGQLVLALGDPSGEVNSILSGVITSTSGEVKLTDGNYTMFMTDMIGDKNASGVLVNLKGEVVGLFSPVLSKQKEEGMISAVSLSELKPLLEKLSNAAKIYHLGIEMSTISKETSEEKNIPAGVYLTSVEVGSLAFEAGLRVGDVITQMNGQTIDDVREMKNHILALSSGDALEIVVERLGGREYKEVTCSATLP